MSIEEYISYSEKSLPKINLMNSKYKQFNLSENLERASKSLLCNLKEEQTKTIEMHELGLNLEEQSKNILKLRKEQRDKKGREIVNKIIERQKEKQRKLKSKSEQTYNLSEIGETVENYIDKLILGIIFIPVAILILIILQCLINI